MSDEASKAVAHQAILLPLLHGPSMEVTVTAEKTKATWNIPKALLSHHPEYFRAACERPFKEGLENKITLSDCDPSGFQVFVQWMYFTTFIDPAQSPHDKSVRGVLRLWALGDRLIAAGFKDCAMKYIYEHSRMHIGISLISRDDLRWCWSNAPSGSTLHCYFLDCLARFWTLRRTNAISEPWRQLFDDCPGLSTEVLFAISGLPVVANSSTSIKPLAAYLEVKEANVPKEAKNFEKRTAA